MKGYELTIDQIANLVHCATNNMKDFVMDEKVFINEWMYREGIDHIEGKLYTERDMDNAYDKGFQDAIGHIKPIH